MVSPEGYAVARDAMMGCHGPAALQRAIEADFALNEASTTMELVAFIFADLLILGAMTVLPLIYFIAFLRIMGRMAGVGRGRFVAGCVASTLALPVAFAISLAFTVSLLPGIAECGGGAG